MKARMKHLLIFLLLAFALVLAGCNGNGTEGTSPNGETTAPTEAVDYHALYEQAVAEISQRQELALDIEYSENRTTGGVPFRKAGSGTAVYTGIGTSWMAALITEDLVFGNYEAKYVQSYLGGKAYTQASGTSFVSEMSPKDFLSYQLPAALIDGNLYSTVTWEEDSEGRIVYQFADAKAFEYWTAISSQAQIIQCSGYAVLDDAGLLVESGYHASYTLGGVQCQLEVKVIISQAQALIQQPQYPTNCVQLEAYLAPRLILQTVGAAYSADNLTGTQTETVYCEAATLSRTQQVQIDATGSGDDFMAQVGYTVSLTNYAGTPTTNTKMETFRNGSYSYCINGGDSIPEHSVTAQQMRHYCEDTLLAALLTPENITGATATDTGEFYVIQFTCKDELSNSTFADVLKLLSLDLDNFAQSFTTETGTAYLAINKLTGMPVSLGRSFTRIHVIDGVSYRTTYQMDSTITLPSSTAYDTILGNTAQETEPESKATPLFYKVTDKKGRTLWLLGTIHVGDNRTGYLPQEIYDAFYAADTLAVEFDTIAFQQQAVSDPVLKSQLAAAYYYSDGSYTAQHLNPDLYKKAYALILASGSNTMDASKMKPAIWQSMLQNFYLSQDCTLASSQGMDYRLLLLARQHSKTIENVESGLAQMQMLTGFSDSVQEMLLSQTVATTLSQYCESVCQLYEAWCQGDEAAILAAFADDTGTMTPEELALYNEYHKSVVTDRNSVMLKAAKDYIKSGKTTFFAVGLTHLLGEDGLVAQLQSAGYTVERVTYDSLNAAQPAA